MSDTRWTKEQMEAITASGCNILVAAAAGAGKTAVLVERVIRKITGGENPVDIDKLLIVTFTNAAATEMRERIGDAIVKALDANPGSQKLQRQLTLLHRANITTIHAFCLEVIRNHFHQLDLDPAFRIVDATESVLLKAEVMEELFEEKYREENAEDAFFRLVESYGGSRDDLKLQDMVLSLYEFVQSHPWPEEWLKESTEAFNPEGEPDFAKTAWGKVILKYLRIELEGLSNLMASAAALSRNSPGLEPYTACLEEDASNIGRLLALCNAALHAPEEAGAALHAPAQAGTALHVPVEAGDALHTSAQAGAVPGWDGLYSAFSALKLSRLPRCGKDADETVQEKVKAARNEAKKQLAKIREDVFPSGSAQITAGLKSLQPLMECLSRLVMDFGNRYASRKREKSLLDFNDLEHLCLAVLTRADENGNIVPSEAAIHFRERFEEILVDEYQDSNLIQEVILGTISRKDAERPNLFMVGDVKQSIYRFRQAKPELFLDKYNTYPAEPGLRDRKILLFKNFRSREEVINAVNYIFRQIMSENAGELDYSDIEALNCGASYKPAGDDAIAGGEAEVHIIDTGGDGSIQYQQHDADTGDNGDDSNEAAGMGEASGVGEADGTGAAVEAEEEQPDTVQCEARLVARRIKELMAPEPDGKAFKVYDKKLDSYRNVEYRDIVILLRSTVNRAGVFVEELVAEGIPAYADTGAGLFKTIEVQTVISLLQVIDNPMQDIPLLAVLRSPIASFTPDELIDIRLSDREATFYEAMRKTVAEGGSEAASKAARFLNTLEGWRDRALYMSTDELIWYLYVDTGYYSFVGAMPGGVQRQANLRMLFEKARQYEETSYKGLFNFINFINRLKSGGGDMGSAKLLGENENVVRIMSIHKSKGLEFPVVIVAGCGKRFNFSDLNASLLFHQDLGFGPDLVDLERRTACSTIPKQALRYKIKLETLSEEMRILYVAFTRAREKLIITGTVGNVAGVLSRWADCLHVPGVKLPEYNMLKACSYLDWIGPALVRHRDGSTLKQYASQEDFLHGSMYEDGSRWLVRLWSKTDVLRKKTEDEQQEEADVLSISEAAGDGQTGSSLYGEIDRRLSWVYPYSILAKLPAKVSVTELKRIASAEFSDELMPERAYQTTLVKGPLFMEEAGGLNPAEKGTIMHFVMQHLDLDRVSGPGDIRRQVEEMILKELITARQAETVDFRRIHRFFGSPLGRRMQKSGRIYREVSFNMELEAGELFKLKEQKAAPDAAVSGSQAGDTFLLQGVVDCYFEEEEGLVLLDYKTDHVPEGGAGLLKDRYRTQIDYYTLALERLTGRKVKDRYIYLFGNGQFIEY